MSTSPEGRGPIDQIAEGLDSIINPQPPLALEGQFATPEQQPILDSQDVLDERNLNFAPAQWVKNQVRKRFIEKVVENFRQPLPAIDPSQYPSYLPHDTEFRSYYRPPLPKRKPWGQKLGEKVGINYEGIVKRVFGDSVRAAMSIHMNPTVPHNRLRLSWEYINAAKVVDKDPRSKHYTLTHGIRSTIFWIGDRLTTLVAVIPLGEMFVDRHYAKIDERKGFINEAAWERMLANYDLAVGLSAVGLTATVIGAPGAIIPFIGDFVVQNRFFDPYIQAHNADVREINMAAMNDAFANPRSVLRRVQLDPTRLPVDLRKAYAQVILDAASRPDGQKAIRKNFRNIERYQRSHANLSTKEQQFQEQMRQLMQKPNPKQKTIDALQEKIDQVAVERYDAWTDYKYAQRLDRIARLAAEQFGSSADAATAYLIQFKSRDKARQRQIDADKQRYPMLQVYITQTENLYKYASAAQKKIDRLRR